MRTITFKKVFNKVCRWHGLNPDRDLPPDLARTIVERINDRVRKIVLDWDWPEWKVTEQRAFRPIWNDSRQFLRVGEDGRRDEVFYLDDELYYGVKDDAVGDPPVGTLPTDTDYWEQIETIDPYIAYSQTCRREIGVVLGVYSDNPRNHVLGGCSANGVRFSPSEKGIDVRGSSNATVYIMYQMPVPQYTIVPHVAGRVYERGVTVFDTTTDECFQSILATNTLPPSTPEAWRRVPFLEKWEMFVTNGAFADSLGEFDQGGNQDLPLKIQMAQMAEARAQQSFETETDSLIAQGQVLKYSFCQSSGGRWCESQQWTGGDVIDISAACEDDLGWVYPTVETVAGVVWRYEYQVTVLRTDDAGPGDIAFDTLNTRLWLPGSRINVVIGPSGSRVASEWLLVTGAYDVDDPGQIQPQDYNAISNDKHWEQIT